MGSFTAIIFKLDYLDRQCKEQSRIAEVRLYDNIAIDYGLITTAAWKKLHEQEDMSGVGKIELLSIC